MPAQAATSPTPARQTKNTAKNVIFILLAGAPSHTDTFDLKVIAGHHARQLRTRHRQRRPLAHRPAAETGRR